MNIKFFAAKTNDSYDFYHKYKEDIYRILNKCFNGATPVNYYYFDCFYVFDAANHLRGFACIGNEHVYQIKGKVKTYKLLDNAIKGDFKVIYPTLFSFCRDKDPLFKGYGGKLLKHIIEHYKGKLYLIPESSTSLKGDKHCGIVDGERYIEDNKDLVKYYHKFGFREIKNVYFQLSCDDKFVYMPVLRI